MAEDHFLQRLRDLARHMAQSGRYCSWRLILIELRFMRGIREAALCFGDTDIRAELDTLCRQAQKQRALRTLPLPAASVPASDSLPAGLAAAAH
ncbi:hypothetical protein EZH22_16510 [Xanthobacter dioxanivorans]|uniref:Uncharacterized protein n=1 Tax=Xanthobacter dioxanivorans TaxID=2528964 RepID=A0A974SGW5_9HYPH|nr:hypothetical protein [Xanthobacter dioxanivorans]QRG04762.1 hypothetical protein EZH22_16510 [Xanthobacter dioxanivorans]